jgi:uncharacterized cysteine cluster protein YcgN (CxxCxxCC family)
MVRPGGSGGGSGRDKSAAGLSCGGGRGFRLYQAIGGPALMDANPLKSPPPDKPFWETKTLGEMTGEEWESLCDGCGRCCLIRFEDEDTGEVIPTRVACRLLDVETCRCTRYRHRKRYVPDCIKLTPVNVAELKWMPPSCAYRRIYDGKGLASWHPLVSGDPQSVEKAGISMKGQLVSETALKRAEDAIDYEASDLLDDGGD